MHRKEKEENGNKNFSISYRNLEITLSVNEIIHENEADTHYQKRFENRML